ncbi:TIGR03087 family PEP-CTERM/XrtA system glycosyltransferase [Alteromonas sp. D210916BOD_24]|uniref:TIGR03087 family PEP-CTERM/XrtA system glycosyltransferase n=1 Tax=Alteromonas sp. D210916BOD_24 TaxID=3157618 RepID=UPI00399CC9D0
MLNISVVAQRVPYPPNKGEKLRTFHQIERLVQLGYSVDVLTLVESPADESHAKALEAALNITVSTFTLPAKPMRYLWAFRKGLPLSVGAFYSESLFHAIIKKMTHEADVLLFSASSLGYYALRGLKKVQCNAHLLMDFMDVDSDKWAQYATSSVFPMSWIYTRESEKVQALEAQINHTFLQTFLIAQEEVALFHRKVSAEKPVKVLGNGMDFSHFYPAVDNHVNQPPNFLFTGVMDYKPNIDAVCWFVEHCWTPIKSKLPNATFTIAGMNPTDQVKALGDVDGVEVTGFVEDILPYFHRACAFVAPFRIARGVQNKVLQATACNLVVVTTPMGAEGIAFASPETMLMASDAKTFAEQCVKAVVDEANARVIAENAFHCIRQQYSWEQQLMPLQTLLESL